MPCYVTLPVKDWLGVPRTTENKVTNTQFFNIAACISGAGSAFLAAVAMAAPNPSSFTACAIASLVLLTIFASVAATIILMES